MNTAAEKVAPNRESIPQGLGRVLADSYTLYLKTHNFHWNVTGEMFTTLHRLFEEQYKELAEAVDDIAERIRTIGEPAPGTYKEFARLSSIDEAEGVPEAREMVRQLLQDHETVARTAREVIQVAADQEDKVTEDLMIQRLSVHEKTSWMLRSHLE